jgi:hypothetical protein
MFTLTAAQATAIRTSLTEAITKRNYITAKVLLEALLAQPPGAEAESDEVSEGATEDVTRSATEDATRIATEDATRSATEDVTKNAAKNETKKATPPAKKPALRGRPTRSSDDEMEERVLRFLRDNPDGASLEQIRASLGLKAKPENEIRALIAADKVYTSGIKRGTKYHPVLESRSEAGARHAAVSVPGGATSFAAFKAAQNPAPDDDDEGEEDGPVAKYANGMYPALG